MKSITEILGGCQMVFGISYDIQEIFEGYVTTEHYNKTINRDREVLK